MIVQTAPEGAKHFVILQHDHARACAQLARAFGNAEFAPLNPADPLVYMVGHHDEGWLAVDAQQVINPQTRLPYHLTQTPTAQLIATGTASPNHNETEHPLCGILSSMHSYGLYHGRYGLSDKIYIDSITPELRTEVDLMLNGELQRQNHLRALLKANSDTAEWAEEPFLFYCYKLLQFFDTLALYVQTTHYQALTPTEFKHVPQSIGQDVTMRATPIGENRIALNPYPFKSAEVSMTTIGRYLEPISATDTQFHLQTTLRATSSVAQTITFVAG